MKRPKILVVGSIAMDLVVSTEKFPGSGETVMANSFRTAPGGKGANQAVQAARLGAQVTMVGKVGDDAFGRELISSAQATGICTEHIRVDPAYATAIASIIVEEKPGEKSKNRILVVPGAGMQTRPEELVFLREEIAQYDMVLLQLEIPMEINELVARYAFEKNVPVMLNPAPSAPLSAELLSHLSYISPNEHEAADLTGITIHKQGINAKRQDVEAAIEVLYRQGVDKVIVTLGSAGAAVFDGEKTVYSPCVDVVEVKDPTAAGDSFVGAFCTALAAGFTHAQALKFANYAATITVSRMGAQPSLPTLDEVTALMRRQRFTGFDLDLLKGLEG